MTGAVIFSDDASDAHAISGESLGYRIIAGSRTGNSVTVSVVDQYGDPMSGVEFWLNSNLDRVTVTWIQRWRLRRHRAKVTRTRSSTPRKSTAPSQDSEDEFRVDRHRSH